MATPAYTGPLGFGELPTRVPGSRPGGAKSTGVLNADTAITTTPTLVYAVHIFTVTGGLELKKAAAQPIIWQFLVVGLYVFQEPLEFPDGLYADVNTAATFCIQYKD